MTKFKMTVSESNHILVPGTLRANDASLRIRADSANPAEKVPDQVRAGLTMMPGRRLVPRIPKHSSLAILNVDVDVM